MAKKIDYTEKVDSTLDNSCSDYTSVDFADLAKAAIDQAGFTLDQQARIAAIMAEEK